MPASSSLLTLNAGSSSLKFAVFDWAGGLRRKVWGNFDRIGLADGQLRLSREAGKMEDVTAISAQTAPDCLPMLREILDNAGASQGLAGIAHRVVHGGIQFRDHAQISPEMIRGLKEVIPLAPNHLPDEIKLMEAAGTYFPDIPQVACFDTVFHRDILPAARQLPIPRRFEAQGLRRYGFHGLSYACLLRQLPGLVGGALANGRVILAHLGNGASLAAVQGGRGVDTTMGLTPLGGLVMATRSGDLDPGVVTAMAALESADSRRCEQILANESGMRGISGSSGDVRELLAREPADAPAAEALAVFCHQARKHLGAMAAGLGGVEVLVFAGGIGENAAVIRERICAPLGFLGIEIDPARNATHGPLISTAAGRVKVFVLKTDEEKEMADIVLGLNVLRGP